MDNFFAGAGIVLLVTLILCAYKMLRDYYYDKQNGFFENKKIYIAAEEFVRGAADDDIRIIIASCLDFDKKDADKILAQSTPHKTDKDGGYGAFIRSVNHVLGADIYNEHYHLSSPANTNYRR